MKFTNLMTLVGMSLLVTGIAQARSLQCTIKLNEMGQDAEIESRVVSAPIKAGEATLQGQLYSNLERGTFFAGLQKGNQLTLHIVDNQGRFAGANGTVKVAQSLTVYSTDGSPAQHFDKVYQDSFKCQVK